MKEELLKEAMALFDSPKKWDAFLTLSEQREPIQNQWWRRLQTELYQRSMYDPHSEWEVYKWNDWDIEWYVKGYPSSSLYIHLWGQAFRVVAGNYLDAAKVATLTAEPRFDAIRKAFDRIDGTSATELAFERKNFSFGAPEDGSFEDVRLLAWYAGNRTCEFADQVMRKVDRLRTPEITALFREINDRCKKEDPE